MALKRNSGEQQLLLQRPVSPRSGIAPEKPQPDRVQHDAPQPSLCYDRVRAPSPRLSVPPGVTLSVPLDAAELLDDPTTRPTSLKASLTRLLRAESRILRSLDSEVVLRVMQTEGGVFTLCRPNGAAMLVTLRLTHNKNTLIIGPGPKAAAGSAKIFSGSKMLPIKTMKEVYIGQVRPSFEKCKMKHKSDMSFSLKCDEGSTHSIFYDFVAATPEGRDLWVRELEKILQDARTPLGSWDLGFIDTEWRSMGCNGVNLAQTLQILQKLNMKPKKKLLQQHFKEVNSNKGTLDYSTFMVLMVSLLMRREITEIFEKCSKNKEYLTVDELKLFHKLYQQEILSTTDATSVVSTFGDPELHLHGFEHYLLSSQNTAMKPTHIVSQDMNAALTNYFIEGCGPHTSSEHLLKCIKRGSARYVEVVCEDGKDGDPITPAGRLQEVCAVIKDLGFSRNPFPVILNLEIKCPAKQQQRIIDVLNSSLSELLAQPLTTKSSAFRLPSPKDLNNKVLLMGRVKGKSISLIPELLNMLYLRAHKFSSFVNLERVKPWDVVVLSEKDLKSGVTFEDLAKKNLIIFHAKRKYMDHSAAWVAGCHIVTSDPASCDPVSLWLNEAKFAENGYCGYCRRPWFQARDSYALEDVPFKEKKEEHHISPSEATQFTSLVVEIFSARALPKPKNDKKGTIDPYVELSILGTPQDCSVQRTKSLRNNGFNPEWFQRFEFPLTLSQHAILILRIMDHDTMSDTLIGHNAIAVNCIRPGYRVLYPVNADGEHPPMCNLFLRFSPQVNPKYVAPMWKQQSELPNLLIYRPPTSEPLFMLSGPEDEKMHFYRHAVAAQTISTYPVSTVDKIRLGDPICDQYRVIVDHECVIFAVADGCNWGNKPKMAASNASTAFIEFVRENCCKASTVKDLGGIVLDGLIRANRSISSHILEEEMTDSVGTTTMLGGVIVPLNEEESATADDIGTASIFYQKGGTSHLQVNAPRKNTCPSPQPKVLSPRVMSKTTDDCTPASRKQYAAHSLRGSATNQNAGTMGRSVTPSSAQSELATVLSVTSDAASVTSSALAARSPSSAALSSSSDSSDSPATNVECKNSQADSLDSDDESPSPSPMATQQQPAAAVASPSPSPALQHQQRHTSWVIVAVNIGDCKAFLWSTENDSLVDLTEGNRAGIDATDPGGRLGLCGESCGPDIRNLRFVFRKVHSGDGVFIVSDGVHDNFDAVSLGEKAENLSIRFTGLTWKEAERASIAELTKLKDEFRVKKLTSMLQDNNSLDPVNPKRIVKTLLRHSVKITSSTREFMESHPNTRLPDDYQAFPGKVDHATCLCLKVGTPSSRPVAQTVQGQ
eukprot:TRINITY_DN224_c2_g1_i1.p1 TRINITY_DN224_c2_g1~~TRINITY_DN224_c2_g1_i1.p1  ORF type:complete len:1437 (+),score=327.44 TRINITY_DN224_c2_g1_i1:298-4311(+)